MKYEAYDKFKEAVKKNLNINDYYVKNVSPEKKGMVFDRENNKYIPFELSEEEVENQAIEKLLCDDTGYFEEFVHEHEIRNEVTELVRVLIKEIVDDL